jgi:site-specific DNA recombinase
MQEKIYVVGYARVSTLKQLQYGDSLEDQEKEIRRYVEKNGYTLIPDNFVFKEGYTGTKYNRPVYDQLLQFVKENKGKIKYFIFWDFDRLTRAGGEDYKRVWNDLKKYGVEPRDCSNIIQPEKDYLEDYDYLDYPFTKARPSEEAERSKVDDAEKDRIKILRRLIVKEINLTNEGYHVRRPPDGYINKKVYVNSKKRCVLAPHPERAKYFIKMFELRASGIHSDAEIVEKINNMGFKTERRKKWNKLHTEIIGYTGEKPLSIKQLQRVVSRPIYAGIKCEKWTNQKPIKGQFDGLVSIELFNEANRGKVYILEEKNGDLSIEYNLSKLSKKRKKYNKDFPLRGVVKCDVCGKKMTASPSRSKSGKYYYSYHCARNHSRFAISKNELEPNFTTLVNKLAFTDKMVRILEKALIYNFRKKEGELAMETSEINRNVSDLEKEKSNLIKSFSMATSDIVRQGLESQVEDLQKEINRAKIERSRIELKEEDITSFIEWGRELMEHPAKMLEDIDSIEEQHSVYGLIFTEFPTCSEILNGTPKLTPVFKLKGKKNIDERRLVTLRGIEPRFHP